MPEEMADVGFGSLIISFIHRKIVFQLGGHYSKIVNEVGMLPGALKIQDIDFFMIEDVIHGIWITVNHAAMGLIDERVVPPVAKKAVVSQSSIPIQPKLVEDLVIMCELVLLAIVRPGMIM